MKKTGSLSMEVSRSALANIPAVFCVMEQLLIMIKVNLKALAQLILEKYRGFPQILRDSSQVSEAPFI